ncbi:IS1-like element transposase, partial [Enterobacter kobei]
AMNGVGCLASARIMGVGLINKLESLPSNLSKR